MNAALVTLAGVVVVALFGFLGTLAASYMSTRSATQAAVTAAQLEERKVNREDFAEITKQLWASITDLNGRLDVETRARRAAEERAEQAESKAAALEQRVDQLEAALGDAGLAIPPTHGDTP